MGCNRTELAAEAYQESARSLMLVVRGRRAWLTRRRSLGLGSEWSPPSFKEGSPTHIQGGRPRTARANSAGFFNVAPRSISGSVHAPEGPLAVRAPRLRTKPVESGRVGHRKAGRIGNVANHHVLNAGSYHRSTPKLRHHSSPWTLAFNLLLDTSRKFPEEIES